MLREVADNEVAIVGGDEEEDDEYEDDDILDDYDEDDEPKGWNSERHGGPKEIRRTFKHVMGMLKNAPTQAAIYEFMYKSDKDEFTKAQVARGIGRTERAARSGLGQMVRSGLVSRHISPAGGKSHYSLRK